MKIKYFPIDKEIIQESVSYEFSMYMLCNKKKTMDCFKQKGSHITSTEKAIINTINVLYVPEEDYPFYEKYLEMSKKSSAHKNLTFYDKTSIMYNEASVVLNNLFSNPESLSNYESAKGIVNEMVDTILNDEFTIKSLMKIASHDYYTHTHSINVTIYSLSLGSYLGLTQQALSDLGESALLHDLGKSKVDVNIINKKAKLTDKEFEEIKKHPMLGYTIGLKLGIKNRDVLEGIRHHHEKMDGSGYPHKMKGEKIPYFARIIAICDIFDALTSKRSYKEAMTSFEALLLMKTTMKEHIDIKILNNMINMFR
jgi:HD-GYP domain-containing protein (c-di-GMP phosphodiesterase class II)